MTLIRAWLDFAIQQVAAESYIDRFLSGEIGLASALKMGSNNSPGDLSDTDILPGKTRMTTLQAQAFVQRYQIVDHHANDASGFSATLIKDLNDQTGKTYTLSFRSSEYAADANGGDRSRDIFGADEEILRSGFAFAQLVSMERYYEELKTSGKLPAGVTLNVTGFSLGGHLATIFTELNVNEVNQAFTFNGAGRGDFRGLTFTDETQEADRIRAMIADLDARLRLTDPLGSLFASGSTLNIYGDERYVVALDAVKALYPTRGVQEITNGGIERGDGAFAKIQQLVGHADTGDFEFVANSGIHAKSVTMLIEGQPIIEHINTDDLYESQFGNSHSITLIVDSLALQDLFLTIDPTLTQAQIEKIFKAASDATAELVGQTRVAEGDTLELGLYVLRKVFLGPQASATGFNDNAGGFGDLSFRNQFYDNIQSVKDALNGQTYQIVSLVDMPLETLKGNALLPSEIGTAYRYAVKNLNPFVVQGADYSRISNPGDLDLYDPTTGNGSITLEYLKDRATFLVNKLSVNASTFPSVTGAGISASSWTYYRDNQNSYEIGSSAVSMRQMIFGNATDETIDGSRFWGDRLYGGDGADTINGKDGDDYIEGNEGNDVLLSGESGNDTILGGQGDDLLDGGTGNDTLDGGLDNDTMRGGAGVDRYIIRAVDGADTIEDSDGKGVVEFDGQILGGALQRMGDPANIFHSADGTITFTKNSTNLLVTGSGPLTIMNFTNGQLGIRLMDLPNFGQATRTVFDKIDHYVQVGNNPDGTPIYDPVYAAFFDNNANDTRTTANPGQLVPAIGDKNNLIHALGGDDYIFSGAGDDQLYGDGGIDQIYGGLGNDRLFGGSDDDWLYGDDGTNSSSGGNDYLDGADGNDFLQGGAGRDILLGGAGNDLLSGDETAGSNPGASDNSGAFDDWLDGGIGDDILHGGAGSDVLIGGADNDWLVGDTTQYQNGTPQQGGNDVLDGGTGDDELDGLYGDDFLSGGGGKDLLNGQDGSDVLYGGSDNDILSGDLRIQSVGEGQYVYDTNEYRAAGGDDVLFGEDGNDIMVGGEGNDFLNGDVGNDSLFGGYNTGLVSSSDPLYWTLFTAWGNDWLDAGAGNDVVYGGIGSDTLLGEEGDDVLVGSGGDDELEGGTGDDRLYGDYFPGEFAGNSQITALAGNNRLHGGVGNDDLYGGDQADTLIGGDGNDRLFGGKGVDVLLAGDGDDRIVDDDPGVPGVGDNETLDGGAGNDYLESWGGDDVLLGGTGNDTLVSHAGNDQLFGEEGDDRLIWDTTVEGGDHPNTSSTSTQILYGGSGDDVYEIKAAGADAMEFANEGTDLVINSADEIYTLPDNIENLNTGATGIGNALDNVISATVAAEGRGGNDTLIGPGRLDGGVGDDLLEGGSRLYIFAPPPPPSPGGLTGELELPPPVLTSITNTYVFGVGYGHDTIQEMDAEFNSTYYQNEDTVEFLSGIAPSDISWERQGNDLELSVNSGADSGADRLTIQSFYDLSFNVGGYNVNGLWVPPQGFETTTFAGFPSYYAHSRVESFTFADGTVWTADHFGAPLLGDFHADTYQFGRGAGDVTVIDFDFWNPSSPEKQVDSLDVGPEVSPGDLSVSIENGADLVLSIDGTEDSFTMQSFLTSVVVFPPFSSFGYFTLPYQIEQVRFDDGPIWSLGDLYNRISTISGTANVDFLSGNSRDNLIKGLEGNDSLYGGGGNDVLDGGAGNDYLEGGTGSDTYLFGRGGGQDTLRSEDWTGTDLEVVRLGFDVLPSDVTIRAGGTGEDVIMQINGTSDQLTLNRFLSGPVYQIDQLVFENGTVWDTATIMANAQESTLTGTDGPDTLRGSVLSDVLSGLGGNDVLIGFGGNDRLIGGTGDDDLDGGAGNDTYVFNVGDGVDTVYDAAVSGEGNRIQFGDGIAPSDLSFERIDTWLFIHVGSGDDTIRLRNFDPTGVSGTLVVETLHFADGSTANLANLLVSAVNHAPTVANPLADQIVPEDASFSIAIPANTFADEDSGDMLTYSANLATGDALPSWLSFNAATQTFSGMPDDAQVGSLDLRVTATDTSNLTASDVFTLTVQNVNEAPAVASPLADQSVQEDAAFSIQVPANTFTDPDAGDVLTYSPSLANGAVLPAWLSFDAVSRTFSGMPDDAQVGSLDLRVTATDTGNLTASGLFTLTVQNVNEAPLLASPLADQQATQGTGFTFVVPASTFTDVDPGDSLTYSATLVNEATLPTWLSFNSLARTFSGTPQSGDVGTLDVRVTATDAGALSVVDVFTLTIAPSGGTAGNDTLIGTSGNDLLDGLAGDDVLQGLGGNDTLIGGAGNDVLDGGAGADAMTGGTGNDTYIVDNAGDAITENANEGTDTVQSSITYTLGANVENLTLTGTTAINGTGNALTNILTGNSTANVLTGGAGNDTYYIGAGDTVVEQANQGTDTVVTDQSYTLGANVENLTLSGTANLNGTGNTLNNVLTGNSGDNLLDGGTGADTLIGGLGNDTYLVDNAGDVVMENTNEGIDTVQSSITSTLGANVEILALTGTAAINGTGNALNNVLIGNNGNNILSGGAGNDRLDGGAGSDTMIGGTGDDTYVVNQAGDVVTENLNEGTDTVESSITYTLGSNLENLTLTGTANLVGTGNTLNNILIGNSGANALDAGAGNDTLDGGAGNDTLQGGSGDDTVIGGLGDDVLSAGIGNDVLDGGDGTDTLDGSSGDDILRGGAGNDTLSGGSGADQLTGGTGNDTLAGGSGNDLYNFASGDGRDTIGDSDSLQGNQDRLLFGTTINPLDLVISRQVNDLRLTIHGTTDSVTIQNWYTSVSTNQIEDLQAGNGQHLLNTQVDQLIQAMASFSQQTGLTWDQAIDQRPQDVQTVLAASWH